MATECASTGSLVRGVTGGEDAHLSGQLRRHVEDDLAVVDQPVRKVAADTVAALHRPHPLREPAPGLQHLRIASVIRAIPTLHHYLTAFIDDLDRG